MEKIKILVAIDDPDWSGIIVQTLFNLINREKAKIILLNVMEVTSAEEQLFYRYPEMYIGYEARKTKFAYIGDFLEKQGIEHLFIFEEGDATESILKTAGKMGVDLVVTGSHNKKIFEKLLLGSVTYKTLRLFPGSVMVISSKYHIHNIRKKDFNVLLAINGSDPSFWAAMGLANLLDTDRARVHLLNVTVDPHDTIPPESYAFTNIDRIIEEAQHVSAENLDKATKILERKGLNCVEKVSLSGKPASVIIDYAEKNSIDLIAMGSHGKKDIEMLFLGSVSAKVTENSEIPVLIIKKR